jgi:hypothetical protein
MNRKIYVAVLLLSLLAGSAIAAEDPALRGCVGWNNMRPDDKTFFLLGWLTATSTADLVVLWSLPPGQKKDDLRAQHPVLYYLWPSGGRIDGMTREVDAWCQRSENQNAMIAEIIAQIVTAERKKWER